jgi:hypothetical protein
MTKTAEVKLLRVLDGLRSDPVDVISTIAFLCRGRHLDRRRTSASAWEAPAPHSLPKIVKHLARFAEVEFDNNPAHRVLFEAYLDAAACLNLGVKIHSPANGAGTLAALFEARKIIALGHAEQAGPGELGGVAGFGGIANLSSACGLHAAW